MQLFEKAIVAAWSYHNTPAQDYVSEVLDLLQSSPLDSAPAKADGEHGDDGEGRFRCGAGVSWGFLSLLLLVLIMLSCLDVI